MTFMKNIIVGELPKTLRGKFALGGKNDGMSMGKGVRLYVLLFHYAFMF